jgi:hypothetical protein
MAMHVFKQNLYPILPYRYFNPGAVHREEVNHARLWSRKIVSLQPGNLTIEAVLHTGVKTAV